MDIINKTKENVMNGFFITLRKFSKESAMYLLYATCFFCLLFYVGNFGGSFISVLGNLFLMVVEIAMERTLATYLFTPQRVRSQTTSVEAPSETRLTATNRGSCRLRLPPSPSRKV